MDNETLYEDGDEACSVTIELTPSGLDIKASNANGNVWGTTFDLSELHAMCARLKA
jgi:hypothetical protein